MVPPHFNPSSSLAWARLAQDIQDWILDYPLIVNLSKRWYHQAFWLAFVGGYPDFPSGQWPSWDHSIHLEGTIAERIMQGAVSRSIELTEDIDDEKEAEVKDALDTSGREVNASLLVRRRAELLEHIWTEFRAHIGLPGW